MCLYASNLRRPASNLSTTPRFAVIESTRVPQYTLLRHQLRQSTWKCLVKSPRCHSGMAESSCYHPCRGRRLVGVGFRIARSRPS
jgi:hypothetical protein